MSPQRKPEHEQHCEPKTAHEQIDSYLRNAHTTATTAQPHANDSARTDCENNGRWAALEPGTANQANYKA